ncbi:MAG: DUF4375 domain-containing protein [Pyrinomonadaceae bacterium]|nr:DUF4375 domain-containing protein [Pyrinomonadaceae bacterium]
MEISTRENEKLVSAVYERAMKAVHAEESIGKNENIVYQIELLSQEVNSGASFEQYFRWVGKPEVDSILEWLQVLEMPEVDTIVQEAIAVAFPNGVPEDESEYEECTEWNEDQEVRLNRLFERFEKFNGAITNKLGEFILEHGLG